MWFSGILSSLYFIFFFFFSSCIVCVYSFLCLCYSWFIMQFSLYEYCDVLLYKFYVFFSILFVCVRNKNYVICFYFCIGIFLSIIFVSLHVYMSYYLFKFVFISLFSVYSIFSSMYYAILCYWILLYVYSIIWYCFCLSL